MTEFQVILMISPYEKTLLECVKESFGRLGDVQIVNLFNNHPPYPTQAIALSVEDTPKGAQGSLCVFAEVVIPSNGYRLSSQIWEISCRPGPSSYPVDTQDGIKFETSKDVRYHGLSQKEVIEHLMTQFYDEYVHDNPDLPKVTFYISGL